jgi:hypothetical protein
VGEDGNEPRSAAFNLDDYGRGTYHPESGLWDYYDVPEEVQQRQVAPSWADVLEEWPLVEGAFQHVYQLDLSDLLHTRSWRWFAVRVSYLIAVPGNPLNTVFGPKHEGG